MLREICVWSVHLNTNRRLILHRSTLECQGFALSCQWRNATLAKLDELTVERRDFPRCWRMEINVKTNWYNGDQDYREREKNWIRVNHSQKQRERLYRRALNFMESRTPGACSDSSVLRHRRSVRANLMLKERATCSSTGRTRLLRTTNPNDPSWIDDLALNLHLQPTARWIEVEKGWE